jgi:hypothetical protein
LGAQVANNDMNSELCWTAMVWFIFWSVYLSSAEKKKEYLAVPSFPLTCVLGLAVTLLWLWAQVQNIMFLGLGLPGPMQRENRGVQQLSSWTVEFSLRAIAQKIQWLHFFPRGFGGPEGFPQKPWTSSLYKVSLYHDALRKQEGSYADRQWLQTSWGDIQQTNRWQIIGMWHSHSYPWDKPA